MSIAEASKSRGGIQPALVDVMRRPGFLACVLTLAGLTAVFYGTLWDVQRRKLPAPLRAPLATLDKAALAPYRCVDVSRLAPEALDSLGTQEYILWALLDEDIKDNDNPVRQASLFVTYYTGQPDPVPHIPENCYQGAGHLVSASEDYTVDVPALHRQVPVRLLEFEKKGRLGVERPIVAYTFGANGGFAADRNEVRQAIAAPWEAYAYFSKVEVRFQGLSGSVPTREQAKAATAKFLRVLLPLLVENHWPDWKALHEEPEGTRK